MTKKKSVTPVYAPTPQEAQVLARYSERVKGQVPAPELKLIPKPSGQLELEVNHPDQSIGWSLLMELLNIQEPAFISGLINQMVIAGTTGNTPDQSKINTILSMVLGIEPRDTLENMLALQMAATHNLVMQAARRLATVEMIPQQDSAERAFNKLARTFTTQMETLKRYRSTGEQTVTVQHVTVGEGGQAIVGPVTVGGGEDKKVEETPCT
jgi:hypothetical protein